MPNALYPFKRARPGRVYDEEGTDTEAVFSRFFVVENTATVAERKRVLQADRAWQQVINRPISN